MPTKEAIRQDVIEASTQTDKALTPTRYANAGEYNARIAYEVFDISDGEDAWVLLLDELDLPAKHMSTAGRREKLSCPSCNGGDSAITRVQSQTFRCRCCDTQCQRIDARLTYFAEETDISTLLDNPQPAPDLSDDFAIPNDLKDIIATLDISSRRTYEATPVVYLVGDERAAIRTFISENTDLVRKHFGTQHNRPLSNWDKTTRIILRQQWQRYKAKNRDDPQRMTLSLD